MNNRVKLKKTLEPVPTKNSLWTLKINKKPVLVVHMEANDAADAKKVLKGSPHRKGSSYMQDFKHEFIHPDGSPLLKNGDKYSVRPSTKDEAKKFWEGYRDVPERDYEWIEEVTVFLVSVKAYHDTVDDQDVYKTVKWMWR